jgi:PAS domain S-box-containing protein
MDKELRILILEDVPSDAELEEHELRKSGLVFTLKIVDTEETFLKELDEFFPDIILSDYDLPTFDGLAALRIAKEKCPDVPFILVTGKLGEEFAIEKLKEGARDYVLKGNLKRLVPSVKRALEEAKQITERKRAEEALRFSEERYRSVVENIGIGISLISPNMEILALNKQMKTWFPHIDVSSRPICYRSFNDPPREEICSYCPACKTLQDGQVHEDVTETPAKDKVIAFRLISSPVKDITEHKNAEKALRESEAQLRAILDATPFPIALVDLQDSKIDFWSRSALALFGHTAPTAQEWYEIAYPDPVYRREAVERWKSMLEKARSSGKTVNTGEYRVSCRDGSVLICELYATFLADRLIVTFNDITEREALKRIK